MSISRKFLLAYHPINSEEAAQVDSYLSLANYDIRHLKCDENEETVNFNDLVFELDLPVILLVSDNFLKSANCVYHILGLFKHFVGRGEFFCIRVEGREKNPESGLWEGVATKFTRISDIIKYINYWQDIYLTLRGHKSELPEMEAQDLEDQLRDIRSISTDIGEFLRRLKDTDVYDFNKLLENNFQALFQAFGDHSQYTDYLQNVAEEAEKELENKKSEEPNLPFEGNTANPVWEDWDQESKFYPKDEEPLELPAVNTSTEDIASSEETLAPLDNLETLFNEEETSEQTSIEDKIIEHSVREIEIDNMEDDLVTKVKKVANRLIQQDEIEEGLSVYMKNLAVHPQNIPLRYEYAIALAKVAGEFDTSREQLELVVKIEPNHGPALFFLGELEELENKFTNAEAYYKKSIECTPLVSDGYYRLALLYQRHFENREQDAIALFEKTLDIDKNNVDALYRLASLLSEQSDTAHKAAKTFKKVLKLNANHPFANYDLAVYYHKSGETEKAERHYRLACKINPELDTPENNKAFIQKAKVKMNPPEFHQSTNGVILPDAQSNAQSEKGEEVMLKTVMITGATSGIGKATAKLFAEKGHRLILIARRADRLAELKRQFKTDYQTEVEVLPFDVRKVKACRKAIKALEGKWRNIDILINNAGLAKGLAPIHEGDFEHWEQMIDTNIKGVLYMTRLVAPIMVENKKGHIVNVGSTAGKEVYPNGAVYCATKHAVEALTKGMRLDLHKHNIRVSQVSPGHVEETEFALVRFDGDREKAKIYEDFTPVNSSDIANAIYYMATRPAHVNIQDIYLMGTQQASGLVINRSGRK